MSVSIPVTARFVKPSLAASTDIEAGAQGRALSREAALAVALLSDEPLYITPTIAPGIPATDAPYLLAKALLVAGYTPLPIDPNDHKGKRPAAVCWITGHWSPWRERQPTAAELRKWWPPGTRHEVGIILPDAVVCVDAEGVIGHDDVDLSAQAALLDPIRPLLADHPTEETTSGGCHYYGRCLTDWRPASGCSRLTPEGVEIRRPGSFVKVHDLLLVLPAPSDLPLLPDGVLELFTRRRPRPPAPRQDPIPDEELAPWRVMFPALAWTGNAARAKCEFHDDQEPSFAVFRGRTGKLYGYCHAKCVGSGVKHGGDLRDIRRLWVQTKRGKERVAEEIAAAWKWLGENLSGDAEILTKGILIEIEGISQRRGFDPTDWIKGMTYRRMAKLSALDRLQGEGREALLELSGRRINRVLDWLPKAGFGVKVGTPDKPGEKGIATAIRFPPQAFAALSETVVLSGQDYRSVRPRQDYRFASSLYTPGGETIIRERDIGADRAS